MPLVEIAVTPNTRPVQKTPGRAARSLPGVSFLRPAEIRAPQAEGELILNSGLIGKIHKAHRYAQEPERIRIQAMTATFNGDNSAYNLSLHDDTWKCNCHTYDTFGDCQHVMALQSLLRPMLSEDAQGTTQHASPVGADGSSTGAQ